MLPANENVRNVKFPVPAGRPKSKKRHGKESDRIISVLNGSPKGEYSITLQTMRYLEKLHPEHTFEQRDDRPYKKLLDSLDKSTATARKP